MVTIILISLIITLLFNVLSILDTWLWYKVNRNIKNPFKCAIEDALVGFSYSFIPIINILLLVASISWLIITFKVIMKKQREKE